MTGCFDFAAEARQRIIIQSDTEASDPYGGESSTWGTQSTVWAKAIPKSDFTRFQSQNLQARVTHNFIIRYQSALADVKETVKHRISLDSRLYDVRGIKNVDETLKNYGKAFQIILADEAGPDV